MSILVGNKYITTDLKQETVNKQIVKWVTMFISSCTVKVALSNSYRKMQLLYSSNATVYLAATR